MPCLRRIEVKTSNSSSKTRGAAPRTRMTWRSFLGSEEPLLKLLRSLKLQRTNSSPISDCRHSKSAIFISRNINYNINSLLRLHVGTRIIYMYVRCAFRNEELNISLPCVSWRFSLFHIFGKDNSRSSSPARSFGILSS